MPSLHDASQPNYYQTVNSIKLKGWKASNYQVKQRPARQTKIALVCPRCGYKKSVAAVQTEHMILCPRCGAGMRERV
jgi:uncharacterized paraquat-inducible protein A